MYFAIEYDSMDVIQYLLQYEKESKYYEVLNIALQLDKSYYQMFIPYSEDIKRGCTLLHAAAKAGNLRVVKENIHLVGKYNYYGKTALSLALKYSYGHNEIRKYSEIVDILNHYTCERTNKDGKTMLMCHIHYIYNYHHYSLFED